MLYDWKSVILFVCGAQAFIFGALLILRSKERPHNRILGLLLLLFVFNLIEYGILRTPFGFYNAANLFGYRYPIRLCIGPLFLMYTSKLTQIKVLKFRQFIPHFLPAVMSLCVMSPLLFEPYTRKLFILSHFNFVEHPFYYTTTSMISIISVMSMSIYIALSLKKLNAYKRVKNQKYASKIWINAFYHFTLISLFVVVGYTTLTILKNLNVFDGSSLYYLLTLLLTLPLMTLGLIGQNRFASIDANPNKKEMTITQNQIEVNEKDLMRINSIMVEKKRFLEIDLTINTLAQDLKIPAHVLSKQINLGFQKTFFTYVNEYRVEHAKALLSNSNTKILAVALDSGFSNKSSFHRTFKRITGTTPYQFRIKMAEME